MTKVRVKVNQDTLKRLKSSPEWVRELTKQAEPLRRAAVRRAPQSEKGSHGRPSGYLRANIRIRAGRRADGAYVRVVTEARTPKGVPYGIIQQKRRQYIRPSTS